MYDRPLNHTDICTLADYLCGTEEELCIAMSELGFDPNLYDDEELRLWLRREAGVIQRDDGIWKRK